MNDSHESLSQASTENIQIFSKSFSSESSLDQDTIQSLSDNNTTIDNEYKTRTETLKYIRRRTIEEIMLGSDTSISNLSSHEMESTQSTTKESATDINFNLDTYPNSRFSFSDDEKSTERFEKELDNMKAKSKGIEEIIDKFLSKV